MAHIIYRVVYEEAEFWNNSQLVAQTTTKIIAHRAQVCGYVADYLLALF